MKGLFCASEAISCYVVGFPGGMLAMRRNFFQMSALSISRAVPRAN
jgi:hypothetical protein